MPTFSSIAHKIVPRPRFVLALDCNQILVVHAYGLGHSCSKLCPILCRLRNKLCPNFGRSRARLCPISFAPCPFPNLAGTLHGDIDHLHPSHANQSHHHLSCTYHMPIKAITISPVHITRQSKPSRSAHGIHCTPIKAIRIIMTELFKIYMLVAKLFVFVFSYEKICWYTQVIKDYSQNILSKIFSPVHSYNVNANITAFVLHIYKIRV